MAKIMEVENNAINLIGVGTNIKGNVESSGDIRIDGGLVGNLKTNGKVVIGSTGVVKGEIVCKNSDLEGKIEGKIIVSELLSLKATSVINGDIVAKRLAIEPGARFIGNCNMGDGAATQPSASPKFEEKSEKIEKPEKVK